LGWKEAAGSHAMKLPLSVKSDYFKGLLVLSRRDRVIDNRERDFLIRVGEVLDFDRRFCETTIDELLSNVNITRNPIVFADEDIKESFFRDALRIAFSDGYVHATEFRWLRTMAHANGKSDEWLDAIVREFSETHDTQNLWVQLEIQKHT
jgi:hypothetical protein